MKAMSVGIDRRLQLKWLESTAGLYLASTPTAQIAAALKEMIGDKLSSDAAGGRGAMEKTITILMKIWATTPKELRPFRDDGLKLLQTGTSESRMAVHWGMTLAVYPFWGQVAEVTGKLLKLQGSASMQQIVRRVREQLGDRQTVIRAAQRVVRSFIDWRVLADSSDKGVYIIAPQIVIEQPDLAAWLVEAVLRSGDADSASSKAVVNSGSIFPFKVAAQPVSPLNPRVELHRQGLDEDVLVLRTITA